MIMGALLGVDHRCLRIAPHPVRTHNMPRAEMLVRVLAKDDADGIEELVVKIAGSSQSLGSSDLLRSAGPARPKVLV